MKPVTTGGIEGLIAFDPYAQKITHSTCPVYITKFSIYNQEITVHTNHSPLKQCMMNTDKIVLSHDQSSISFDVALLSYSTMASNRYYYKMVPLDKDWIKAASNQNISFTKLPQGNYTFIVKATDGKNGSPHVTRSLSIVVLPPWWKTIWAYILYYLCGFSLIIYWFLWYWKHKEKQMEERQKLFEIEKEKEVYESKISFFTSIAHEIRTPLTLINGPLETINEMGIDEPKLNKNLSVIGQNTKRLLNLTGQLLDFQKIGADKFDLKFESVDITSLLNETLARFEPTIVQKKKEEMFLFIQERLEEHFAVETAHNGKEALEILKNTHVDLVISDIMMPVMNGYDLCRTIKADINLCHIPVIFLTAKNDLDSKINGLKLGAEAYVEKPFSFNYLKTQIFSLLNNRRIEREAFIKRPFFPVHNMQMNKGDEELANRIIREIQNNITDINFGVERMAENLGMSRSNLLRKIKNLFNLSPVDFIRLIRLKKAAEFIQEGKFRIGEICYMVGINSPSYFGKLFLKQFGMTPKEFEKQSREKSGGKVKS